ncbi:MAG TPA: hypothetical protein VGR00_05765, partial [Thermoanaerobaculia bacterium]|nr:hypothetical protein [Thermoanaerobaculia bacterium]
MPLKRSLGREAAAALLALLSVLPLGAAAQTAENKTDRLEQQVEELKRELATLKSSSADSRLAEIEKKIDALTKEIEELKLGEAAAPPEKPALTLGLGPAASKVYGKKGVSIGGYGDVLYQNFRAKRQDGAASGADDTIDLERAVLYFGYKFSDDFVFNSEVEYEHAVAAPDKEGEVEVEFAYVDWTKSRAFNLRAGLVLIPMGFLNEEHEPPTFFGARRNDVETRILPTTWRELGIGAYGSAGVLSWRAYLVNGLNAAGYDAEEGIREGRQEGSLAKARNFAFTARLDAAPAPGLRAGASIFTGSSGQGLVDSSGERFDASTTVWDLHAEYRWRGLTVRGLYAGVSISDAEKIDEASGLEGEDSVASRLSGWYLEGGYDVLSLVAGTKLSLSPFLRYERYDTQSRVPDGFDRNPENDVNVFTLGLSFKPIAEVVVKVDWQ